MQILFLTDNFYPEVNAPASRTYEHAKEWVKQGAEVTVITCAPNFPEGKVYPGYKNSWCKKSELDGIRVIRVKTYMTANSGMALRMLDFLSFMLMSFIVGCFQKKPDIIIGTSPQFFTAVSAWAVAAIKRVPFVFELRDLWPESIKAVGAMNDSLAIKLLEKLELFLYRRAAAIISVTNSFKRVLTERGVAEEKIHVVRNGVNLEHFSPVSTKDKELSERLKLNNKFVVGYIGTHGMAHALDGVINAAEQLKNNPDIAFLLVGAGASKQNVDSMITDKKLTNVISLGRQSKEDIIRYYSLCDVLLVTLQNNKLFETVIPSKIFEAMGMGLPILISIPRGEAVEIVEHTESGLWIEPENAAVMTSTILELYNSSEKVNEFKANSAKSALKYDRAELAKLMLKILKETCLKQ